MPSTSLAEQDTMSIFLSGLGLVGALIFVCLCLVALWKFKHILERFTPIPGELSEQEAKDESKEESPETNEPVRAVREDFDYSIYKD